MLADPYLVEADAVGMQHGLHVLLENLGHVAPDRMHGHHEYAELHGVFLAA